MLLYKIMVWHYSPLLDQSTWLRSIKRRYVNLLLHCGFNRSDEILLCQTNDVRRHRWQKAK